jgi:hypothetical protein
MTTALLSTLLSAAGLAALGLLLLPARPQAWGALGGTLGLTQRDLRVFNNFTDPEANDNTVPDPSFPGALGAPLAIWKGAVEWGSERHGDGFGDPTQPGDLGSGGANFDPTWQGLASGVGGVDDNVVSEISGFSLGVLAYTELPISDGWRIRFYADAAVWEDGPGAFPPLPDHKDIQGVACHEYGHALGLAHSGISDQLTMFPSGSGTNVNKRSIEWDDVDGVRGLYGVRAATKPHVDGYELSGGNVTISGSRFDVLANEVWFTNGAPNADGTPLVVANLPSSAGGTRITLAVPAAALPGDVLVRVPGSRGAALSNAYPFDPAQASCPLPVVYGTPKTTSQGTLPALATSGRPRLAVNDFAIETGGGIPGVSGVLFSGAHANAAPFQGGTLYVSRPLRREVPFVFDFLGGVSIPIPVTPQLIGQTRCYQLWFQDAGDPFGVGLSNAVQVTFCP